MYTYSYFKNGCEKFNIIKIMYKWIGLWSVNYIFIWIGCDKYLEDTPDVFYFHDY